MADHTVSSSAKSPIPSDASRPQAAGRAGFRRADWRFLLPTPPTGSFEHLVLLGGPAGVAEAVVELGLARRVSCEMPTEQPPESDGVRFADALIVLHDAGVAPWRAARCLLPGGFLYCEIDRHLPSFLTFTPARAHRALAGAGLSPLGVYWPVPHFENCRKYVPLDVSGALRWYLSTLFVATTLHLRLVELGVRALTGLRVRRFAPLVPYYSVTAVRPPTQGLVPSLLAHDALPEELREPDVRPLVLTSGQDDGSRLVMLPFGADDVQPKAVLKVARLPAFNINTEREQATLTAVRAPLDRSMRHTVPEPLGTLRYGSLAVGVETCAPGVPLATSSGRWDAPLHRRIDDLRLAASWLADFHRQAQVRRPSWDEPEIAQWIEMPIAAYIRAFGVTSAEDELFTEIRRHSRRPVGASLPIVFLHNDFNPWNLYRSGQRLTVIDWEFGRDWEHERFGPALCDLLYLVTHWSFTVRHLVAEDEQVRYVQKLFVERDPRDPVSGAAQVVLADYMCELAIDPRFLPLLLVYTWIERALDHTNRQRSLGRPVRDSRAGNQFVRYIATLAQHRDQFLGGRKTQP
jgi:Phosphotransferase enzyme family